MTACCLAWWSGGRYCCLDGAGFLPSEAWGDTSCPCLHIWPHGSGKCDHGERLLEVPSQHCPRLATGTQLLLKPVLAQGPQDWAEEAKGPPHS
jgi:hypothetical protein